MAKRENRKDYYSVWPEDLTIQDDPKGKFYDSRVDLPLIEETVLNIMAVGVQETIIAVPFEGQDYVISGRQRVKHAIEANKRLKAKGDAALMVPVRFVRDSDKTPILDVCLNEHRQDDSLLTKIDKAMGLREKGYSDEDIAASFRIGVAQLKNWFKADTLCAPVKKAIEQGKIALTAASKFADLPAADQKEAVEKLIESGVKPTVRAATKAVAGEKPERKGWTRREFSDFAENDAMPEEFREFVKYTYFGEEDADLSDLKFLK